MWSLIPLYFDMDQPQFVTFDQPNVAEVMLHDFQAKS